MFVPKGACIVCRPLNDSTHPEPSLSFLIQRILQLLDPYLQNKRFLEDTKISQLRSSIFKIIQKFWQITELAEEFGALKRVLAALNAPAGRVRSE